MEMFPWSAEGGAGVFVLHWQLRYIILLCFALKYYHPKEKDLLSLYRENMTEDLLFCWDCFQSQVEQCQQFYKHVNNHYQIRQTLLLQILEILPKKWRRREIQWLISKDNPAKSDELLYKYKGKRKYELQGDVNRYNNHYDDLLIQYESLPGSLQYCRLDDRNDFTRALFNESLTEESSFNTTMISAHHHIYSLINIEPIIMKVLKEHNFPVPDTRGTLCGFSMIQLEAGKPLTEYEFAPVAIKPKIALQLIEASVRFTWGFKDQYHLYLTDLTARNVLYDQQTQLIHFIDLDSIFVVKSREVNQQSPLSIHRYEHIDCPGCLAFIPYDLCVQDISDLNIYIVCRFLNGDLFQEMAGGQGFLSSLPSDYRNLEFLLQKCIDCPLDECENRLHLVESIQSTIREMLHSNKFNKSTEY